MADIPSRSNLEQDFARRMAKLSERHRRELLELLGNPPDPKRVTQDFWDRVEREEREELMLLLLLIFMASGSYQAASAAGDRAAADAEVELQRQATTFASQRADQLAADITTNSRAMLQEAAAGWVQQQRMAVEAAEAEAISSGTPLGLAGNTAFEEAITDEEIENIANRIFGPNRIEGIAVTETTTAISAGGDAGIDETVGVSADDLWITERDSNVCRICQPLHKKPRAEWDGYFPSGPPAHPRCRCYIQYANAAVPAAVGTP